MALRKFVVVPLQRGDGCDLYISDGAIELTTEKNLQETVQLALIRCPNHNSAFLVELKPRDNPDWRCGGASLGLPAEKIMMRTNGSKLGKRYIDPRTGTELLCTKAGDGLPQIDGHPLFVLTPKALPSSD